jgi:hypothetical protein
MAKALMGAAMLGAGGLLEAITGGAASPMLAAVIQAMVAGGISMEAGAIAQALADNRGVGISTRQAAGLRQVVYGEQRIGGTIIYQSTTGFGNSGLPMFNMVIALAGHQIDSIVNLYLDGRQVFWRGNSGNTTRNGINFGGTSADGLQSNTPGAVLNETGSGQHPYYGSGLSYGIGPGGIHYGFSDKVYCEARYGDQLPGDVIAALSGRDRNWSASDQYNAVSPWVGGCTYVYLCVGYDSDDFPSLPEIRFTVRGKNDIYDPRTGKRGYTTNWALIVADVLTDPVWGLGDTSDARATAVITPVITGGSTNWELVSGNIYEEVTTGGTITGGTLTSITLVDGGNGYTTPPTVYIEPPRPAGTVYPPPVGTLTQATATASINASGTVTGFTITNPGAGYTTTPLITLTPSPNAAINQEQLIAAANVCDEQVLTSQGYESNYTLNLHYDTSTSPGDALALMMPAAAGRLSRIGGQWFVWPAYWKGPSFTFDESALVGPVKWTPYRSFKDLFNRVNGTYIAPNYPYNCVGNLYDANGWWYGQEDNVWPYAWQPTNFPQYAHDALHGWGFDKYLLADGGVVLPKELTLRGVISIVQAQRVAKINLMRNRQQGSGVFPMSLAAWQMQPTDVMNFSFPALGWSGKVLEIDSVRFAAEEQEGGGEEGGDRPLALNVQVSVQETDPSIYEWNGVQSTSINMNGAGYTTPPTVTFNANLSAGCYAVLNGSQVQFVYVSNGGWFASTPTVTLVGGGGSGATCTAVLASGASQSNPQPIVSFNVTNHGSGYTTAPWVQITGGGTQTTVGTATAQLEGMGVGAVTITGAGSGYTAPPFVNFSGTGSGATAQASIAGGEVVQIQILTPGEGYTSPPTVTIGAPASGTTAAATCALAGSSVMTILPATGTGYTSPPTVSYTQQPVYGGVVYAQVAYSPVIVDGSIVAIPQNQTLQGGMAGSLVGGYPNGMPAVTLTGGGGSGAAAYGMGANANSTVDPSAGGGYLNSITVTNQGSGYTSAPTVTITDPGGGGFGWSGTATISSGKVTAVSLDFVDWTYFVGVPTITFSGGGGSGAAATPVMSFAMDGISIQCGSGYTSQPTVTLSAPDLPGGQQATATAILGVGAQVGQIAGFTIVNAGSGYLNPPTVTITGGGGTGAIGIACLASSTVAGFTLTSGGAGYCAGINPAVVITGGGGVGAQALTTAAGGVVTSIVGEISPIEWDTFPEEMSPDDVPTNGAAPATAGTVAVGSAAGSGATATLTGIPSVGLVALTTGASGCGAGTICIVTFPATLSGVPAVGLVYSGIPGVTLSSVATTTTLTLSASAALDMNTTYQISYSLS